MTALATELPETVPIRPLATTAALPAPPWLRPVRATAKSMKNCPAPEVFPWEDAWWKPTTPRRDLVKAAALILAEIERLDRMAAEKQEGE